MVSVVLMTYNLLILLFQTLQSGFEILINSLLLTQGFSNRVGHKFHVLFAFILKNIHNATRMFLLL